MKKITFIAICIALFSCKDKENIYKVSTEVKPEIVAKSDSLFSPKYAVTVNTITEKAELDFSSLGFAKHYKTQIRKGYDEGKINFAGHYILIKWGCGMACLEGVITDVLTGKMYEIPRVKMANARPNEISFKPNSTYLVAGLSGFFEGKEVFTKQSHWNWNEKTKTLDFIKNDKVKEDIAAQ